MSTSNEYFPSAIGLPYEVFASCIFPKLDPFTKRILACVAKVFQYLQEKELFRLIEENKNVQFVMVPFLGKAGELTLFDTEIQKVIKSEVASSEKIGQVRAYLNAKKVDNLYLLHYFADKAWEKEIRMIFDFLLDLGVDLNKIDHLFNPTALFRALKWSSESTLDEKIAVATKLIDAGADPRVVDVWDKTAFELSQQVGCKVPNILSEQKIKQLKEYAKGRVAFMERNKKPIPKIDPEQKQKFLEDIYRIREERD